MHLNWLEIHRYPRVVAGTKLNFDRGINMAVGKNGTGKTTLLELLAMIASGDLSPLEKTEFDVEWHGSGSGLEFEVRLTNQTTPAPVQAGPRGRPSWVYEVVLRGTTNAHVIGTTTSLAWTTQDGNGGPRTSLAAPVSPFDSSFPFALMYYEHPEQFLMPFANVSAGSAGRFDEALGNHLAILGEVAPRNRLLPRPTQIDLEHDRDGALLPGEQTHFAPYDLVYWLMQHSDGAARVDVSPIVSTMLREAMSLIGAGSCDASMRQTVATADSITRQRYDQLELRFHFPSGAKVAQDQLSYGQQRIVSYYYYLAASPSIVVADELVNGMHHDWIAACVASLGDRQAFLSSQNPLLLDQLPFENPEQISRSLVICTANENGEFIWRNANDAEARRIGAALDVGIQQVSEVLEAHGLW